MTADVLYDAHILILHTVRIPSFVRSLQIEAAIILIIIIIIHKQTFKESGICDQSAVVIIICTLVRWCVWQGRDFPWDGCSRAFCWMPVSAAEQSVEGPVCCLDMLLTCLSSKVIKSRTQLILHEEMIGAGRMM